MEQPVRKRRRKWPWIILGLLALYALWWVLTPISWTSTSVEHFPNGVDVRTTSLHELCAYVGIEGTIIPVPYYYVNDEHERAILVDGKEWVKTDGVNVARAYISPGRTYMILEDQVTTTPIRILDLSARQITELIVDPSKDEFPGHYNVYPFHFVRWEDDSNFLVEVTGSSLENVKYPQSWRVDAKTRKRTRADQ